MDRPDLRDGDLEIGEYLEEKGFELVVDAVELVEEQNGRTAVCAGLERLQYRTFDQKSRAEDIGEVLTLAARLGQPDRHDLLRVVPLVDGVRDVDPLVALQPNKRCIEQISQDFGHFRLAYARLAFEEQRLAETQRQVHGGSQR